MIGPETIASQSTSQIFDYLSETVNYCTRKWLHHFALRILDLEDPSFGKEEEKPSWHRESAESADCELSEESSTTADEDNYGPKEFPLFLSVPIVLLYLLLVSFVISFFDWDHNGAEGIDFGDAFYFSSVIVSLIERHDRFCFKISSGSSHSLQLASAM
jgi:hypothetical protein